MGIQIRGSDDSITPDDGTMTINGLSGLTVGDINYPANGQLSNRNLIINGAMKVAQRGTTFTSVVSGSYTLDRWAFANGTSGVFDVTQSSTAPAGFANSLKVDCTTAATPTGTQECFIRQYVEAQNLQQLQYGTAGAKSVKMSFWVRSNKTGDFGVHFYSQDGDRRYSTTYSISSADTWEHKSVTISGDTAGTINDDNGRGFEIRFYFMAGPDRAGTPANTWGTDADNRTTDMNLGDSTNNEWLITGVQLEVGSVATPFEHRSFGDELARCQRYFHKSFNQGTAPAQNAGNAGGAGFISCYAGVHEMTYFYPVPLRDTPTTITTFSPNAATSNWATNGDSPTASISVSGAGRCTIRASTPAAAGRLYWIHLTADAEL